MLPGGPDPGREEVVRGRTGGTLARLLPSAMPLMTLLVCATTAAALPEPPLDRFDEAMRLIESGQINDAREILADLRERMPHKPGLAYDLALLMFMEGTYPAADSIIASLPADGFEGVSADSMTAARAASAIASGMELVDAGKVSGGVSLLRQMCIRNGGLSSEDAWNLEVALDWLRENEPPPSGGGQGENAEGEQEEEEEERDDDGSGGDESEEEQPDSGQQEDGQPDRGEGQDEETPEDGSAEPAREGTTMEDLEAMLDSIAGDRMTPEEARAILDLIEEAAEAADTTSGVRSGGTIGPEW